MAVEQGTYGEVFDRGYQHYDGPRLGQPAAVWALTTYSMKRALGIKKSFGAKVIPVLLYVGIIIPVIVAIGIKGFLSQAEVMTYASFFAVTFLIEGIFVATIAPEMLCGDRRENVLPLYFSRAITRLDYLLAKLLATAILTLTVSVAPAIVLWLGFQLLEPAPFEAMGQNLPDLGRIILVGTLIAFYLGAIGLMISSFTGRKSIAVGIIVFGFIIFEAISNSLLYAANLPEQWQRIVLFLGPTATVSGLAGAAFNEVTDPMSTMLEMPALLYAGVMIAITLVCCAVMYLRYVPNE